MTSAVDRWHIGDRYYGVTAVSPPETFDLELDDLGPGVGRGTIAIASMPDGSNAINLSVYWSDALPVEVLEQFIAEARRRL